MDFVHSFTYSQTQVVPPPSPLNVVVALLDFRFSMTARNLCLRGLCKIKGSSTLDGNKDLYGCQNLLSAGESSSSGDVESDSDKCWNSSGDGEGSEQWLQFSFETPVSVTSLAWVFQGGFVGQNVTIKCKHTKQKGWVDSTYRFPSGITAPEDSMDEQKFDVLDGEITDVEKLRVEFGGSSDFYGRITMYRGEVWGLLQDA